VTQRLEDYGLGLLPQQMDIPAIHLVKANDVEYNSPHPRHLKQCTCITSSKALAKRIYQSLTMSIHGFLDICETKTAR